MKNILLIISLSLAVFLYSCNKNSNQSKVNEQQKTESKQIIKIPENVDDTFETFLSYFNENMEFQLDRVQFPLQAEMLDGDYENIQVLIEKKDYQHSIFKLKKNEEYNLEISVEVNKSIIEIRGIDNGIMADYEFDKIDNKWILIKITDLST